MRKTFAVEKINGTVVEHSSLVYLSIEVSISFFYISEINSAVPLG